MKRFIILILFLVSFAICSEGASTVKHKAWVDPVKAAKEDPDFLVQGEYGMDKPGADYGVQVVALGGGEFDAYVYQGGLLGLGWTPEKSKEQLRGKRECCNVKFSPFSTNKKQSVIKYKGIIAGGKFILTFENSKSVVLNRLERKSPTLGAKPPKGAIVLFDGTTAERWKNGVVKDGYLQATGAMTKQHFGDYYLHLEFRTPYMPSARWQQRGNSGVYHSGRWETQILDTFGIERREAGCGGIYSISKPRFNMCLPPLEWQTYDVDFTAAKFDTFGRRIAWPRITVRLNGVLVHENLELAKNFTTSAPITSELSNPMGPIYLQNHKNPVVFRNIWVNIPKKSK